MGYNLGDGFIACPLVAERGFHGPRGEKGDKGETGPPGPDGPRGWPGNYGNSEPSPAVVNHGSLGGLGGDDHPQYVKTEQLQSYPSRTEMTNAINGITLPQTTAGPGLSKESSVISIDTSASGGVGTIALGRCAASVAAGGLTSSLSSVNITTTSAIVVSGSLPGTWRNISGFLIPGNSAGLFIRVS